VFGNQQSKQAEPHQGRKPPSSRHALGVPIAASVGAAGLFAAVVLLLPGPATKDAGTPPQPEATVASAPSATTPVPEATDPPSSASAAPPKSVTPKPKPPVPVKPTPPPKPRPVVYKKLTTREWAKLVKSPDDHVGESIQLYGYVTQFDAATGADGFRADTDARRRSEYYDYSENTVLQQSTGADVLADIVEGDLFSAKVLVIGAYNYDTQTGGSTTVPSFSIVSISVIGHQD